MPVEIRPIEPKDRAALTAAVDRGTRTRVPAMLEPGEVEAISPNRLKAPPGSGSASPAGPDYLVEPAASLTGRRGVERALLGRAELAIGAELRNDAARRPRPRFAEF